MNDIDLIELLRNTGPVNRLILLVLLIFSVWSWGIILSKMMHFKKVRQESELFWKIFRKGQSLSEIATACETASRRLICSPSRFAVGAGSDPR